MAVFGAAYSLTVLGIGALYRSIGTELDQLLFKNQWREAIAPDRRGGLIHKFVHCPACNSFWLSLGATFWYCPVNRWVLGPCIVDRLAVSFASVGIVWIIHVILTKLGQYEI
jgi:hypothetical protein